MISVKNKFLKFTFFPQISNPNLIPLDSIICARNKIVYKKHSTSFDCLLQCDCSILLCCAGYDCYICINGQNNKLLITGCIA